MQNRTGSPSEAAKSAGWRVKKAEERKKGEPVGERGHKAPPGEASFSEKRECNGGQDRVTPLPTRASRADHERRVCARCARDRITSSVGGEAAGGDRLTSMRWWRTSCMQARRWARENEIPYVQKRGGTACFSRFFTWPAESTQRPHDTWRYPAILRVSARSF
jgi:hypothetical protein